MKPQEEEKESGPDTVRRAVCSCCQGPYEFGSLFRGNSLLCRSDETCLLCGKPACERCSLTWGRQEKHEQKLCVRCADVLGIEYRQNLSARWIPLFRERMNARVRWLECPSCGESANLQRAVLSWDFCLDCGQAVCSRCSVPAESGRGTIRCRPCHAQRLKKDFSRETCTFCGRDDVWGRGGASYEARLEIDRACAFCNRNVCSDCAVFFGRANVHEQKLCPDCSRVTGIIDGRKLDFYWLPVVQQAVASGSDRLRCPSCGRSGELAAALATWTYCFSCRNRVCPDCSQPGPPANPAMSCAACREAARRQAIGDRRRRLRPENNCSVCDGLRHDLSRDENGEIPLAQVFPCTLCGRRICDSCRRNRITERMNVFCCANCLEDPRPVIIRRNPFCAYFAGNEPGARAGLNLLAGLDRWFGRITSIFHD